jgi:hypothetical protein
LDDYRWLIGPQAAGLIDEAGGVGGTVALTSRLRKSLSSARVHLVLEQADLRRRASEKFANASRMFFTRRGLEQATDEIVAAYKSSRMPSGRVADLCCGIGGDLLALARRGPVLAVDRDPISALLSEANCAACGIAPTDTGLQILTDDVAHTSMEGCVAAHLDPDRRPAGRRTTHIEAHQPDQQQIEQLLDRLPDMALKLAPATEPPAVWLERAEWEWISRGGQCRQLVAWFGALAGCAGSRRATILRADGTSQTLSGNHQVAILPCDKIGRYLYEPDAAVLAAGLEGTLAAEHGLEAISPGIAYLTGDAPLCDAALAGFEIEDVLPLDLKQLRGVLHKRGIGRLEIKKRGLPHDPQRVRRDLALQGSAEATLVLTRRSGKAIALLCRRLSQGVDPIRFIRSSDPRLIRNEFTR